MMTVMMMGHGTVSVDVCGACSRLHSLQSERCAPRTMCTMQTIISHSHWSMIICATFSFLFFSCFSSRRPASAAPFWKYNEFRSTKILLFGKWHFVRLTNQCGLSGHINKHNFDHQKRFRLRDCVWMRACVCMRVCLWYDLNSVCLNFDRYCCCCCWCDHFIKWLESAATSLWFFCILSNLINLA